ncbi:DinB family protein [Pseudonocardia sp. KRD-184]|uniref:DinB family protein n=1 Tax=Pseudonocardia oceani TaxID=2792013 RepID=A0ABS6UCT4_9PSEU|nr:DinB family protein [Pseudonocardia oceani]MBW0091486.1 DinB family protein [Pseudonocardia oceani]MBW0098610.1 DinB family protein [Pseudonocardia oceani]MBW0111170.1 DinB family protein [Pseudonocardia oceani]MBW0125061.1 DinB family protein [Pseudonocardia oceani]MBW0129674.1 DinB family protein [Pseudonocardia oceani]
MTDTERADILESLATHRGFLLTTVQGLTDEQARQRTTVSELTLGGLIKHVARTEKGWTDFIEQGPVAMEATGDSWAEHADGFVLHEDETLAGVLAEYADIAKHTDALVESLPSLDLAHPLPEAPWFPAGATRSARRVFVHIVGETAQHAGHADILREAIDGQKTMG